MKQGDECFCVEETHQVLHEIYSLHPSAFASLGEGPLLQRDYGTMASPAGAQLTVKREGDGLEKE